jgi:hypothetical protein
MELADIPVLLLDCSQNAKLTTDDCQGFKQMKAHENAKDN